MMRLMIEVEAAAVENLIHRKYEEAVKGCVCYDCQITKSILLAVLRLDEEETQ